MDVEAARKHITTAQAELDQALQALDGEVTTPPENVIDVKAGDNLLAMIETAPEGSTFRIATDYEGDLGTTSIRIPCRLESAAPLTAGRVTEALIGPTLRGSLIAAAPDITFAGLRMIGTGATILTTGPKTTVDRCLLLGPNNGPQHRGIATNSEDVTITKSHIGRIWKDIDTQAVGCWTGTKRLKVQDCYLEASGENFMAGGADPASEDLIPEDLLFEDCTFFKPLEWKGRGDIGVKNLFELKNCKKVVVRRCTFENNWTDAQTGTAIVFTVRNQDGRATWSTIEDVLFEECHIKDIGSGFSILGRDYSHPSQIMQRVTIRKCTVEGISRTHAEANSAAHGRALILSGGPHGLIFEDCDFTGNPGVINAAISFDQMHNPILGLEIRRCKFHQGTYGMVGEANAPLGLPQITAHAPGYLWEKVTIYRKADSRNISWPADTEVITE